MGWRLPAGWQSRQLPFARVVTHSLTIFIADFGAPPVH
jgi:hypothetical protein